MARTTAAKTTETKVDETKVDETKVDEAEAAESQTAKTSGDTEKVVVEGSKLETETDKTADAREETGDDRPTVVISKGRNTGVYSTFDTTGLAGAPVDRSSRIEGVDDVFEVADTEKKGESK